MKNKYPNTRDDLQSTGGSYGVPPLGLIVFIGLLVAIIITTLNK
tara:strand:- start:47 stop:178 length:132 start_codon:yes stop_codon:yes gene_type:complete